jgi:hypothetical protein
VDQRTAQSPQTQRHPPDLETEEHCPAAPSAAEDPGPMAVLDQSVLAQEGEIIPPADPDISLN